MTDYDRPQLYKKEIRTARKQHTCGECSREIYAGEQYQYVRAIWDHQPGHAKTCAHCLQGQRLLMDKCGGFLHHGIDEDLAEHIRDALPWSMQAARLLIGMRRKWLRFDSSGLMQIPMVTA